MSFLHSMGIRFSSRSQSPPQPSLREKDPQLRSKRRKSRTPSPRRLTVQEQLQQLQRGQQPVHPRNPEPPDTQRRHQSMFIQRQPSNQHLRPQAPVYPDVQRPRTTSFPPPAVQPMPTGFQPGTVPTAPVPAPPAIPQQNPTNAYANLRPLDPTDDNDPRLPARPFPNSYWATPQLLGSEYPSKGPPEASIARLDRLVSLGIVDFIDLTEPGEALPGEPYAVNMLPWIARKRGMGMVRMARMHESHQRHRRSFSAGVSGQVTGPQAVHVQQHPHMLAPEDARGRGHNRYSSEPTHRTGITGDEGADWAVPVTRNTIRVAQYPIRDTTLPDLQTLSTILTALAHSQAQGRRAIVHCNGGYGRTGTIIGCWYVHSGVAQAATVYYPGQYMQYRLPSGQIQLVPYVAKRSAGERALELLAKKWKGVEKSRTAPYTPGNQMQMDFVKAFKPPPPPVQKQGPVPVPVPVAPPLQRSRTGR